MLWQDTGIDTDVGQAKGLHCHGGQVQRSSQDLAAAFAIGAIKGEDFHFASLGKPKVKDLFFDALQFAPDHLMATMPRAANCVCD